MQAPSYEMTLSEIGDDDMFDSDGVPEDGRQAWLSLLLIGLIAGSAATLLYAVIWVVAASA